MKKVVPQTKKSDIYGSRANWPPYTYRDYPDIKPETYNSFMEFLSTENTSDKVMELQPWISFCDSRCTFCYYPTTPYSKTAIDPYLSALKKELEMYAETKYVKTSEFDEIVLGGGTPSLLTAEQMIDLISFCEKNFNTTKDYMIKITGSSRSFNEKKLAAVAKYGVYQVDIGAQTFDNNLRKMLNLPDDTENVEREIKAARKLGLCVCIDLMYNLPGQTVESWTDSVKKAIELDVEVDCYSLEVYPGTILDKQLKSSQVPPLGDSETEKKMYLAAYDLFTQAGYKPVGHDRFSRVEWHFKESCLNGWPWAGILTTGAGCFMGYLQRYSYSNIESAKEYMEAVRNGRFPISKLSKSTEEEMMRKVMTKLYLRLPVDKHEFLQHFGKLPEEVFPDQLKRLQEKSLIAIDEKEIKITRLGDVWKTNIAWEFAAPT
ncbi:MAG: coproporphyrinogen-III oxidase family protein [Candidatus Bathyarchaeota archaeon]|nr:coproporphyrinogen-III oxidase family protein [Candidatus Bathyarchaeota archaeon]